MTSSLVPSYARLFFVLMESTLLQEGEWNFIVLIFKM